MRPIFLVVSTCIAFGGCTMPAELPAPQGDENISSRRSALGVPVGDFPNWQEQVIYTLTNRLRADPQAELDASCTMCGTTSYAPLLPLGWSHEQALAARFHATSLIKAKSGLSHDTVCRLVSNIGEIYPDLCDGSPSCACEGGSADCGCDDLDPSPTAKRYCSCAGGACPSAGSRVHKFGASYSGENAAAGYDDPARTVVQWINSSGHRANLLNSMHSSLGVGYFADSGGCWRQFNVQVFGMAGGAGKIPGGAHHPEAGTASTSFTFHANYHDPAGAPESALINIDGACQALELERGVESHGSYRFDSKLGAGCHRYYFVFRDENNTLITYPTVGSYGVGVSGASCPFYEASRPALGQGCGSCKVASDCDDGNPCTAAACDGDACSYSPMPGCCVADSECDDGDLCTKDRCANDNSCSNSRYTGCCLSDAECDDDDACTEDSCQQNRCVFSAKEACCNADSECDDGDVCTLDRCEEHVCVPEPIYGCCNQHVDCDDGSDCTLDRCEQNSCLAMPLDSCCTTDADCRDNDVCSNERCDTSTGTCVFDDEESCCAHASECDDGHACTEDSCELNRCVSVQIDDCGEGPSGRNVLEGGCSLDPSPTPLRPFLALLLLALLRRR